MQAAIVRGRRSSAGRVGFRQYLNRHLVFVPALCVGLFATATVTAGEIFSNLEARYAGAGAGDWSNPGNIVGPADNNCANMGAVDKANLTYSFGFGIPGDATITGVVAHTKAGENGAQTVGVQLASNASVDPPTLIGSQRNLDVPAAGSGACSATVFGATTGNDLAGWGLANLTPATVNTAQFGLVFTKLETSSLKVDSICVEITYEIEEEETVAVSCFQEPPPRGNTLTVVKALEGAAPGTDWDFTGSGDIEGPFTLPAAGGSQAFLGLEDETYTITETVKPGYTVSVVCTIDDVVVDTGEESAEIELAEGQSAVCTFTNTLVGTFTVRKLYTDDNEDPVSVTATCTEPATVTNNPQPASPTASAVFEVSGVTEATTCTATEVVPAGYEADQSDCQDGDPINGGCAITNSPLPRTTFTVTKDFTDDNPAHVDVEISCFTGLPLVQSQEIWEGQDVEFVVEAFDQGELDCDISEVIPEGYSPTYEGSIVEGDADEPTEDALGCHFENVVSGEFLCTIVNTPDPVDVVIEKVWVIEGAGGDQVDTSNELQLFCDAEIVDGSTECSYQNGEGPGSIVEDDIWCQTFPGDDSAIFTGQVIPEYPDSHCWVDENVYDSSVEIDNDCRNLVVSAGHGDSCVITNTVFFEGIPALNQHGVAILALLMLGIGFVGFRRLA